MANRPEFEVSISILSRAVLVLSLATPISLAWGFGEWPQAGYDATRTWFNAEEHLLGVHNVATLEIKFSVYSAFTGRPAFAREQGIVCTTDRVVRSVDLSESLYLYAEMPGNNCNAPAIWGDDVLTTSSDGDAGFLMATDVRAGSPRRYLVSVPPSPGEPTVANGIVYLTNRSNQVHAFDAATGDTVWSTTTPSPTENGAGEASWINNDPTVGDGKVFVTTRASSPADVLKRVFAFDAATGILQWSQPMNGGALAYPALFAWHRVWAHAHNGLLRGFDAATGTVAWERRLPGRPHAPLAAAGHLLFASSGVGDIVALRAGTGRIAWTHSLERGVVASNFALAGGVLFLTAYDGSRGDHFLVTLDAASGAMIAQSSRSRLTGRSAALAVTQGKVRLLTDSSYLSGIGLPD
jgi:outer membrane protein assembly factor BamB